MTLAGPARPASSGRRGQPLLFLATVLLLWTGARIVHHLPGKDRPLAPALLVGQDMALPAKAVPRATPGPLPLAAQVGPIGFDAALPGRRIAPDARPGFDVTMAHHLLWAQTLTSAGSHAVGPTPADGPLLIEPVPVALSPVDAAPAAIAQAAISRWSVYGWSLVRHGRGSRTLAPAAQYGGSQAGLLIRRALGDGLSGPAIYARAAGALANADDRTIAIGLSARPWPGIPVDLAVERRFGLARGQTDRFAAMLVAAAETSPGRSDVRLEAYGQAGIVGWKERQGFFDLQMLATRRVAARGSAQVSVGGGLWAGGQQEVDSDGRKTWVHRVDLGPRAALALLAGDTQMTLALDWRQRVDGQARPTSGAALTLSAGF